MFTEDQLLPISALQHLIFCERQCALIHVERLWAENQFTAEGNQLHNKVHDEGQSQNKDIRVARALAVRSFELGLVGQADLVEFHSQDLVIPIEYKRGIPKKSRADEVQLCAQAICLEEMLGLSITAGYLFYGKRKRRTEVQLDHQLRLTTRHTTERLHQMIGNRETPAAIREPKCDHCSLVHLCLPDSMRFSKGITAFVNPPN